MATKRLHVFPNPYLALDHDGYPAGACQTDRMEHVGATVRSWVGAAIDEKQTFHTEKLTNFEQAFRFPAQQTRFRFDLDTPTVLPVTQYYRDRVRDGELIPADAATAKLCDVPFVDPKDALAKSKAAAVADWRARYQEDPELVDALESPVGIDVPADGVVRTFNLEASPAIQRADELSAPAVEQTGRSRGADRKADR